MNFDGFLLGRESLRYVGKLTGTVILKKLWGWPRVKYKVALSDALTKRIIAKKSIKERDRQERTNGRHRNIPNHRPRPQSPCCDFSAVPILAEVIARRLESSQQGHLKTYIVAMSGANLLVAATSLPRSFWPLHT